MRRIIDLLGANQSQIAPFFGKDIQVPEPETIEDRSYINMYSRGISFVLPDHISVGAIHLHADGHEGFVGYDNALPFELDYGMSRSKVREVLGKPERSGEEGNLPILGRKAAWDRFNADGGCVHVEYALGGGSIQLVTLMQKTTMAVH